MPHPSDFHCLSKAGETMHMVWPMESTVKRGHGDPRKLALVWRRCFDYCFVQETEMRAVQ